MAKKIWLVVLTIITVAFVLSLLILSVKDMQAHPTEWLTEQEALDRYYEVLP